MIHMLRPVNMMPGSMISDDWVPPREAASQRCLSIAETSKQGRVDRVCVTLHMKVINLL